MIPTMNYPIPHRASDTARNGALRVRRPTWLCYLIVEAIFAFSSSFNACKTTISCLFLYGLHPLRQTLRFVVIELMLSY